MAFSFVRIILEDTEIEIYQRGVDYFNRRSIVGKPAGTAAYKATVSGTDDYLVDLGFKRTGSPKYACSCPYFEKNGWVCKHIIAAALMWDDARNVPSLTLEDAQILCIPPPDVTYADIKKAFDDPLHSDLNVIRLAADNTGNWSRPHVRLPEKPRQCSMPFNNMNQLAQARKSLLHWPNRRGFDLYFCAGEMEAGFCEILRWLEISFITLSVTDRLSVLKIAAEMHHEVIECIDGSDGIHIFGELHLLNLCDMVGNEKNLLFEEREVLKKIRARITEY